MDKELQECVLRISNQRLQTFIEFASIEEGIDKNRLNTAFYKFTKSKVSPTNGVVEKTCKYEFTKGNHKGEKCGTKIKISNSNYCSKHKKNNDDELVAAAQDDIQFISEESETELEKDNEIEVIEVTEEDEPDEPDELSFEEYST